MLSFCRTQVLLTLALSLALLLALAACGAAAPPQEIALTLRVVNGGMSPDTVSVRQGDTITARIESNQTGVIHWHGYDLEMEVSPESPAELQFTADATGRFPITFHETPASGDSGEHSHDHNAAADHDSTEHGSRESAGPVSLDFAAEGDGEGGLQIRISAENWQWAPEEVNQEARPGVGHAHIYANGEKLSRIYAPVHYVPDLPPGRHEIKVDLNDNAHNALTVNGAPLEVVKTVTIPARADTGMAALAPVAAAGPMSIELIAHPDSPSGYNLQIVPTGFAFDGSQGYGLLSIDGIAVTRLYADWLQLPPLEPGTHTVHVALLDQAGRPYHWQGQPVAAEITVGGEMDGGMGKEISATDSGHEQEPATAAGESAELELGFLVVEPR